MGDDNDHCRDDLCIRRGQSRCYSTDALRSADSKNRFSLPRSGTLPAQKLSLSSSAHFWEVGRVGTHRPSVLLHPAAGSVDPTPLAFRLPRHSSALTLLPYARGGAES